MKCNQCQNEMIKDCNVNVEGGMYGIKISKKVKGLFNKVSAKPKAAVCSNCGYVAFYIDEYNEFSE
ncbi:nucleic acid-binding protein [Metabacillus litoralis]|uniref:Nucleic acid-binding protein n=1 Tax=Metabacillus litoralis TaxID=152268 RepID=A0A5C6VAM4_9BACI|nr:nucleic acid-binding protein [Metabacillus litoralis]TXC81591.1 nucleic acid-binding protein [Metabacillus litoralis]